MSIPGQRPCKGCGKPIVVAKQADGIPIPLDLTAPVYRYEPDFTGELVATRDVGAYVSHFASCPKADQFSASKRKAAR